jgi:hypothetical protein
MERKKIIQLALIMVLLFPAVTPISWVNASKGPVLPNVEIVTPKDGETVDGRVEIRVEAQGRGLENPFLSIEGENVGTGFQMRDCAISIPIGATADETSSSEKPEIVPPVEHMVCRYKWDTGSFEGQKVRITSSVSDNYGSDKDDVVVRVSGHLNFAGNRIINHNLINSGRWTMT